MEAPAIEIVTMKNIKNDLIIRSKYERCNTENLKMNGTKGDYSLVLSTEAVRGSAL